MNVTIQPGKLYGNVTAPPSKSYGHRMLICAHLSEGDPVICGLSESEDIRATQDCLAALQGGAQNVTQTAAHRDGAPATDLPTFPCRESGSTLRFFIPLALTLCGGGVFTGTSRLIERGIGIYEEVFAKARTRGANISVEKEAEKITLRGKLPAGAYQLRGDVSSQFITGMLLALPLLEEDSTLYVLPPVESRPYIDITIDVMKQFGVVIEEKEPNVFTVRGGQTYRASAANAGTATAGANADTNSGAAVYQVEGDWSNGAFLYGFNAVGADLHIDGLNPDSLQGDKACVEMFAKLGAASAADASPAIASAADASPAQTPIDISDTPDLGPVLFAVAAAKGGGTFTGIRRLRIKESDRAQAMADELAKFGVRCSITENEMTIKSSGITKPGVPLDGHNDHRIVMALSILASITGGTITGAQAVAKSWPDFFGVMQQAGMKLQIEE